MLENILYYLQTFSWFPTDNGVAHAGRAAAARLRADGRRDVRARHEPAEPRRARRAAAAARAARRAGSGKPALIATTAAVVALIVLPYDFRQALITSLLATVMCLSLVVITGFVGQISIVQLALAGVSGFILSHLADGSRRRLPVGDADRRARRDASAGSSSPSRRCGCAASASPS